MAQKIPPDGFEEGAPLLLLVLAAAVLGIIAQLAVNLALGLSQKKRVLAGLLLLSGFISAGATLLLVRLTNVDAYVAATIGTLLGTAPPLLVLRAGLQAAAKRAGISLSDLLGTAPIDQTSWLHAKKQARKGDDDHA